LLDIEECSIEHTEDDIIIEFTLIDEVSDPTIFHVFKYSDAVDSFFSYLKEDEN